MTAIESSVQLGKKLGVVRDRRTFAAEQLLAPVAALPRVPRSHRVGGKLRSVPLFGNDRYGCCVFASQCHAIVTMERSASQHDVPLTEADALQEYHDVAGFVAGDQSTDNGAYELDGLNNWRHNGVGLEKDATPHKIAGFAAVDWDDPEQTMLAHYVFGGLKVCAGLPRRAAEQMNAGEDWDAVSGGDPRDRWGSWGGHSMYSHAYDRDRGLAVWTWGREQWMTWPWIDRYVDEVYCVISEDYLRRGGTTPQHFSIERLQELLSAL